MNEDLTAKDAKAEREGRKERQEVVPLRLSSLRSLRLNVPFETHF